MTHTNNVAFETTYRELIGIMRACCHSRAEGARYLQSVSDSVSFSTDEEANQLLDYLWPSEARGLYKNESPVNFSTEGFQTEGLMREMENRLLAVCKSLCISTTEKANLLARVRERILRGE